MDMAIISGAMAAAKALRELLQAATSLKIDNETLGRINAALNEVSAIQERLFETREQLFTLQKENGELRQQIRSNEEWETQKNHYRLAKTVGGATVWESITDSPKHFACVTCFAKRTIIALQTVNEFYYSCPSCKASYCIRRVSSEEVKMNSEYDLHSRGF